MAETLHTGDNSMTKKWDVSDWTDTENLVERELCPEAVSEGGIEHPVSPQVLLIMAHEFHSALHGIRQRRDVSEWFRDWDAVELLSRVIIRLFEQNISGKRGVDEHIVLKLTDACFKLGFKLVPSDIPVIG